MIAIPQSRQAILTALHRDTALYRDVALLGDPYCVKVCKACPGKSCGADFLLSITRGTQNRKKMAASGRPRRHLSRRSAIALYRSRPENRRGFRRRAPQGGGGGCYREQYDRLIGGTRLIRSGL